jgi:integral membrane sensor domain MASE1
MPIIVRFPNKDDWLAMCYVVLIVIFIYMQGEHMSILEKCQKSVFMLQMPNVTSVQPHLYCDISHYQCHCSIVSVKHCLTDKQLKISRILPLVLFVVQVYLIRELLSLSRDYTFSLVYSTWITCLLIFIGILVIIYRYPCFYECTARILCITGCLLYCLVVFPFLYDNCRSDLMRQQYYG